MIFYSIPAKKLILLSVKSAVRAKKKLHSIRRIQSFPYSVQNQVHSLLPLQLSVLKLRDVKYAIRAKKELHSIRRIQSFPYSVQKKLHSLPLQLSVRAKKITVIFLISTYLSFTKYLIPHGTIALLFNYSSHLLPISNDAF